MTLLLSLEYSSTMFLAASYLELECTTYHSYSLGTANVKKFCTVLHISCKMCKFLALLVLQAKNRARFLHQ